MQPIGAWERVLMRPAPLPPRTIGCRQGPPSCPACPTFTDQEVASKAWAEVVSGLEQEARSLRGLQWTPHRPEVGRARGPVFRRQR
eukprot:4808781-Pyramimonas_sp.AAC.1